MVSAICREETASSVTVGPNARASGILDKSVKGARRYGAFHLADVSLIGLTLAGSKCHKGMSSLAMDLDVSAKSSSIISGLHHYECIAPPPQLLPNHHLNHYLKCRQ